MHFASMSLGIFDFLIEWLTKFLIWIIEFFIDLLLTLFASLFYSIGAQLLNIVDFIQKMFKKLCGLDAFYLNGSKVPGVDPLLSLMTDDTVMQVLLALTMVAFVMVIIAAIIKIIQTEFSTEGSKNSKGAIFGQALKSIMMFVIVPVCCVGGIILSNMLLKMIDMATSLSDGNATIGSSIMVSASAGANKIRMKKDDAPSASDIKSDFGVTVPSVTGTNREEVALAVDNIFRNNTNYEGATGYYYDTWSLFDTDFVGKYYSFKDMNFITLIGGALLAAYTMVMASFGMVMRLFKGGVLFMISPPMVALMPLDGGSAFKQWRTGFLKQVLAGYGTIASLNLLFIVLPAVNNIDLFGPAELGAGGESLAPILNGFAHVLFTLTGLFMLKDISSLISNMIGAEDAAASGSNVAGKVVGTAAKIGGLAAGAGAAVGGLAMKGVGRVASAASKNLAKNGHAGAAKVFGGIGSVVGKAGNIVGKTGMSGLKFGAKGLANDGLTAANNITGGLGGLIPKEVPNAEAREKSKKQREARIKSGDATVFDYIGKGVSTGAQGVADGVSAAAAGVMDSIGAGMAQTGHGISRGQGIGQAMSSGIEEAFQTVVPATKNAYAVNTDKNKADVAVVEDTVKSYQTDASTVAGAHLDNAMLQVGTMLASGDSLGASDQIAQMIAVLQGLADKTEDQKDLLQKLTNLQQQVSSAGGDTTQMANIASSSTFKSIGEMAHDVTLQANAVSGVTIDINNDTTIESQLEAAAEEMKNKVVQAINDERTARGESPLTGPEVQKILDKMKRDILAQQQAQVEKALEKKQGK